MPLEESILNLPEFRIEKIEGREPVHIYAHYIGLVHCPECRNQKVRLKTTFWRKLQHETFGSRLTYIHLRSHKYLCLECGRYFNQRFPGILPYKRSTEPFRHEVFNKHNAGICKQTLAKDLRIGHATVERWYHDIIKIRAVQQTNHPCPFVLGIDEHFFSKRQGYATTLCDLKNNRIYDVVLGRSEESLRRYLSKLPGRDEVKIVVMDLSETYRKIVKRYFPNAIIVADRFHVVRVINHHFLKLWSSIDPIGRKNRGLLSLMRRHAFRLKPDQVIKLDQYFLKFPAMKIIYSVKQELCLLMLNKHKTKRECKPLVFEFFNILEKLYESKIDSMKTLANTLSEWKEEIVRMWRFTKNNGITEGFHNKMELISRRAYGFRNFENYRLRVKALCG